jgi:hypothetical protein
LPARAGKLFDFPIVKALHDAEQDLGRKQFRILQAIGFNCIRVFLEDRVVILGDTNKQALWPFLGEALSMGSMIGFHVR